MFLHILLPLSKSQESHKVPLVVLASWSANTFRFHMFYHDTFDQLVSKTGAQHHCLETEEETEMKGLPIRHHAVFPEKCVPNSKRLYTVNEIINPNMYRHIINTYKQSRHTHDMWTHTLCIFVQRRCHFRGLRLRASLESRSRSTSPQLTTRTSCRSTAGD